MTPPPQSSPAAALPGCWWHPNRQTGLSCVRCGRPACPDCLREASVGYQCIDCVQAARREAQTQRRPVSPGGRTDAGARLSQRVVVTPVLIALNVLMYVITAAQAGNPMDNQSSSVFEQWLMWPAPVALDHQWWRLLTNGFMHYGILHLAVNMFALWVLGRQIEVLLGKVRFTAVYLVSLLGGSVAVYLFGSVNQPTVGASGAIFGLLGGFLVVVLRLRLNPVPVIATIVLNLIITVSIPNISLLAHVGGFVTGAAATAAMLYAPRQGHAGWQAGAMVALVVALVGLVLYRDAQLADLNCTLVRGTTYCS